MKWTFWLGYMLALLSWCAKHDRPIISNITLITLKKCTRIYFIYTNWTVNSSFPTQFFLSNCLPVCLERKSFKKIAKQTSCFYKKNTCVCTLCLSDNYYPVLYDSCRKNDYVFAVVRKMIVSLKITHQKTFKVLPINVYLLYEIQGFHLMLPANMLSTSHRNKMGWDQSCLTLEGMTSFINSTRTKLL